MTLFSFADSVRRLSARRFSARRFSARRLSARRHEGRAPLRAPIIGRKDRREGRPAPTRAPHSRKARGPDPLRAPIRRSGEGGKAGAQHQRHAPSQAPRTPGGTAQPGLFATAFNLGMWGAVGMSVAPTCSSRLQRGVLCQQTQIPLPEDCL